MSLVLNRVSLSKLPLTASPGCLFGQRYCERYSLSSIVKFTQKLTAIRQERSHFVLWGLPKTYSLGRRFWHPFKSCHKFNQFNSSNERERWLGSKPTEQAN